MWYSPYVDEDADLLRRWQDGDSGAGEQLYERYRARIYRFFRTKLNDLSAVEDLVSETFLVVMRSEFAGKSKFSTFLFGIARNKLLEHFRRRRRDGLNDDVTEASAVQLTQERISSVIASRQEQRLLLEALRRIPLDRQILLELFFWEGLSGREIAEMYDVKYPTLRRRIGAAKELLKKEIEALAESPEALRSTLSSLESWAASVSKLLETG